MYHQEINTLHLSSFYVIKTNIPYFSTASKEARYRTIFYLLYIVLL